MNLLEIFNTIIPPGENDEFQFSAIPIPEYNNHRIAKDKKDNPTLLLSISNEAETPHIANIKLQNILVLFDIQCKIELSGILIEKTFTAVSFIGKDILLKRYFLNLCSTLIKNLANTPTHNTVRKEITKFTELFRLAAEPQTKTTQGLWAELLLIAESKEPAKLVKYWHSNPDEKFDFNNGEERIEVKSSSNTIRIHNFSLEQLHPPKDTLTIIASVFVRKASAGKSIDMLSNEIIVRLTEIELIEKLQLQIALTLGKSINESMELKFDYEFAKESLRFYKSEDIPKIAIENIPTFVSDVRFKSDLTDLNTIKPTDFLGNGELFTSI